jgi:hypothetical protein
LKKAAQNFCLTGPVTVKPARPSLKNFFASFFKKEAFSFALLGLAFPFVGGA